MSVRYGTVGLEMVLETEKGRDGTEKGHYKGERKVDEK